MTKTIETGDIIRFNGELMQAIGFIDQPAVLLQQVDMRDMECHGCKRLQTPVVTAVIVSSLLFQKGAEPVSTLKGASS